MQNKYINLIKSVTYFPYNKRSLNRLIAILQRKIGSSYMIAKPYKMTLDVCNICNLKCILCPTGKGLNERKKGYMSFETFKKVIDEVGDYLYYINLFSWGEPFFNKELPKIIEYAKQKKIEVLLGTTLNFYSEEQIEGIIKAKLDRLIVSLDGASQETASKYQKGINFKKTINGFKLFIKKKKELNSKRPIVQWRFIVMKHNEHEIKKAEKISKEIGIDKFELAMVRCDMKEEIFKHPNEQVESLKDWLPKNENLSLYDYKTKLKKKMMKDDCSWLWAHSTINWDGSVSPCDLLYDQKYDFGNFLEEGSFMKVWNNENYKSARKDLKNKKVERLTVCHSCHKNSAME